ncbi:phosphomannomutase/phosphoglucomutase [Candidatus Woesearchaeota archaeon]|nr:phosphomannomutase/phosphoglucomutase [Candidatus Woesearchaeota archaeon]
MLSEIFKAYDVRGIYAQNLTEDIAYKIGKAFVYFLKCKEVIIGTDMRLSSPKLSKAFIKGVTEQGANAIHIGQVSTDAVYFASGYLHKPAVMFTASHNPPEYNGIKFCKAGAIPINENTGLKTIKLIVEKSQFGKGVTTKQWHVKKQGRIIKKDVLRDYVKHVKKAGKIIPLVYKNLPIKIIPLYFRLDGTFPNHPADPSRYENLSELQKIVKEKHCDFGIAFDGDADRIFFIDEKGEIVNSSIISALIIKNILIKNKNQKIVHNVVCSHIVPEIIIKHGGIPIVERVGHSFIKDTMKKTKAIFGCEHSAHFYYKDNYRADSGVITSLIVAEIVSNENKPLSELLLQFKKYYTIEETNAKVVDKDSKLKEVEERYIKQKPKKILKLDGLTIEFSDWWFNVRPSNTEPLLRLNLEAVSKDLMEQKKNELVRLIEN